MSGNTVAAVVPKELRGKRLDEVLATVAPELSRAWLQKLVRRGHVRVDGRVAKRSNVRVQGGERIVLQLDPASARSDSRRGTDAGELRIVHEDDHLVVVDKPAGLLTHPNESKASGTLADLVAERFGRLPASRGANLPGIVHRLDRETSGLIVVARTAIAMEHLVEQFRARRVEKSYLALVHGAPEVPTFEVDRPIARCEGDRARERLGHAGDGKAAHTRFRLVERLGPLSLVACAPTTGRRHQIRLHLLNAGLPILGDKLYGRKGVEPLPDGAPHPRRHALHAAELAFEHPVTGERIRCRADLPVDLKTLVHWLRTRR
jgi:23S rRNA pseudouridine1911/1915/1917 synthase